MTEDEYDPAAFMIANTFTAFKLVKLSIEDDNDGFETVLAAIPVPEAYGVLRAAAALAGQEMVSARGREDALGFCRSAVPGDSA